MANPSNHLPPDFDDIQPPHYDPVFTESISTNMRVPHKLGVSGDVGPGSDFMPDMNHAAPMMVPERIIVAGQEQHIGMKEDMKLNFDPIDQGFQKEYVGLHTPPRTLTLDERPFPSLEQEVREKAEGSYMSAQNGYLPVTPRGTSIQDDLLATPGNGLLLQDSEDMDDMTLLRRQVMKLTRHVTRLEEENSRRSQREIVLYPLILGYMLLQVAKWLLRTN